MMPITTFDPLKRFKAVGSGNAAGQYFGTKSQGECCYSTPKLQVRFGPRPKPLEHKSSLI